MSSPSGRERTLDRRTVLRGALGAGGLVFAGQAAGKPGKGGPPAGKDCDLVVPDDHGSIQDAVDAASAGDTVCVKDGTYREQVVIDTDLTLEAYGDDSPVIEAPDVMESFTIAESGPTWEPVVFAYGGTESGGDVSGSATIEVDVTGLEVDGRNVQPAAKRKVGVLFRNVDGRSRIDANTVRRMGVGGKETMGILAYGSSDVIIEHNTVSEFERGGIGANGDGGAHPSPSVSVRNNTLDSNSALGGWAPNGIQIGFGASAEVRNNAVENCRWASGPDDDWQASGILVFESDDVHMTDNSVTNNDVGIAASSWGYFLESADGNRIMKNTVTDAFVGINLRGIAWAASEQDPSVSNNKVVNNEITDGDGDPSGNVGVAIERVDDSDDFDPVVDNNKVIRNHITGFDDQVTDGGTDTKINAIEP